MTAGLLDDADFRNRALFNLFVRDAGCADSAEVLSLQRHFRAGYEETFARLKKKPKGLTFGTWLHPELSKFTDANLRNANVENALAAVRKAAAEAASGKARALPLPAGIASVIEQAAPRKCTQCKAAMPTAAGKPARFCPQCGREQLPA